MERLCCYEKQVRQVTEKSKSSRFTKDPCVKKQISQVNLFLGSTEILRHG